VIRQAISCDICGTEKKQTNHWFVAYDQAGELRVSGWSSRNRLRPGSKHLCGQTCLHKLVDDFMARALTVRAPRASQIELEDEELVERATTNDTSLTSDGAYKEIESSARLIAAPKPVAPPVAQSTPPVVTTVAPASAPARPQLIMPIELVAALPARQRLDELPVPASEPPRYASRNWRAAAWERERERELRSGERYAGLASRRRFSS
jgi:hypothetical protein